MAVKPARPEKGREIFFDDPWSSELDPLAIPVSDPLQRKINQLQIEQETTQFMQKNFTLFYEELAVGPPSAYYVYLVHRVQFTIGQIAYFLDSPALTLEQVRKKIPNWLGVLALADEIADIYVFAEDNALSWIVYYPQTAWGRVGANAGVYATPERIFQDVIDPSEYIRKTARQYAYDQEYATYEANRDARLAEKAEFQAFTDRARGVILEQAQQEWANPPEALAYGASDQQFPMAPNQHISYYSGRSFYVPDGWTIEQDLTSYSIERDQNQFRTFVMVPTILFSGLLYAIMCPARPFSTFETASDYPVISHQDLLIHTANFGRWLNSSQGPKFRSRPIVAPLAPKTQDYAGTMIKLGRQGQKLKFLDYQQLLRLIM